MTNRKIGILLHFSLVFSFLCVFIFLSIPLALAQEQVTITTYYPAPYGIYKELRADQLAIGSTYRASALADGNLIVSGNVGIRTAAPGVALDVAQNQTIRVGQAYLSSGGDFVHLANNEYYNGAAWVATGAGALLQLSGQTAKIYSHTAAGAHTALLTVQPGNDVGVGRPTSGRFYSSTGGPGVVETGEVWFCQDYT